MTCSRRPVSQLVTCVLAAGVCLAGSEARAQTNPLAGTVISRVGGQPIAGAIVAIEGTNVSSASNAAGRFRLDAAAAGPVVLVVKAPGFLDLRVPDVPVGTP